MEIDADTFYDLSVKYQIDAGYTLAVFIKETGWGRVGNPWTIGNNPAGIVCDTSYCTYSTKNEGLEAMFRLLRNYVDGSIQYVGVKDTAISIREKWCETRDIDEIIGLWNLIGGEK